MAAKILTLMSGKLRRRFTSCTSLGSVRMEALLKRNAFAVVASLCMSGEKSGNCYSSISGVALQGQECASLKRVD